MVNVVAPYSVTQKEHKGLLKFIIFFKAKEYHVDNICIYVIVFLCIIEAANTVPPAVPTVNTSACAMMVCSISDLRL